MRSPSLRADDHVLDPAYGVGKFSFIISLSDCNSGSRSEKSKNYGLYLLLINIYNKY
jgi:hypothetical protein